ncbi:MAG: hypothetical protein FD180_3472 [Planctomycetota bacterium]|nr:MAG: hypothetical protein FD180_3472 [Planctomycetota bacterium]
MQNPAFFGTPPRQARLVELDGRTVYADFDPDSLEEGLSFGEEDFERLRRRVGEPPTAEPGPAPKPDGGPGPDGIGVGGAIAERLRKVLEPPTAGPGPAPVPFDPFGPLGLVRGSRYVATPPPQGLPLWNPLAGDGQRVPLDPKPPREPKKPEPGVAGGGGSFPLFEKLFGSKDKRLPEVGGGKAGPDPGPWDDTSIRPPGVGPVILGAWFVWWFRKPRR